MASFVFNEKPTNSVFLGVDYIATEYELAPTRKSLKGIWVCICGDAHFFKCDEYTVCNPDAATEDGRRQVIELVKELAAMSFNDKNDLFGFCTAPDIISHLSYEEIVQRLDTWKKEKETIRVRDEVCHQSMQVKFVVTKICTPSGGEDAIVNGLKKDGTAVKGLLLCNLKKTGVHVNNLDEYLEV